MNEKPTKVIITGDAKIEYDKLLSMVEHEKQAGITKSDHQILLKAIVHKIEILRTNPDFGVHIPKNQIPKEYILKYEINNLWKINLSGYWRLLYTLRGDKLEIIALILDIIDHKIYNKKFEYKKYSLQQS